MIQALNVPVKADVRTKMIIAEIEMFPVRYPMVGRLKFFWKYRFEMKDEELHVPKCHGLVVEVNEPKMREPTPT